MNARDFFKYISCKSFLFIIFLLHFGICKISCQDAYSEPEERQSIKMDNNFNNTEEVDQSEKESILPTNSRRLWWNYRNRTTIPPEKVNLTPSFTPIDSLRIISNLFRHVILNPSSSSRIQFFNANYKSNPSQNATGFPHVTFGGPLCFGLCGIAQVYWGNSSVDFFSSNRPPFPTLLPPPRPPPVG